MWCFLHHAICISLVFSSPSCCYTPHTDTHSREYLHWAIPLWLASNVIREHSITGRDLKSLMNFTQELYKLWTLSHADRVRFNSVNHINMSEQMAQLAQNISGMCWLSYPSNAGLTVNKVRIVTPKLEGIGTGQFSYRPTLAAYEPGLCIHMQGGRGQSKVRT